MELSDSNLGRLRQKPSFIYSTCSSDSKCIFMDSLVGADLYSNSEILKKYKMCSFASSVLGLLKTAAVTFSQLLNSWTISDSGELLQWITIHHMHANQESCSSQHINFTTLITRSLATSVTESFVQPLRAADSLWVWRLNEENGPGLFSDIGVL